MSAAVMLAVNFLCWCMWFAAINCLLERKLSPGLTLLIELLLFFPYYYVTQLLTAFVTVARTLFGVAEILTAVLLLYRDRWFRKCRVVFLVLLMMLLSEFFAAALLPPELFNSGLQNEKQEAFPLFAYGPYLFSQALLLTAMVLIGRRLRRRHEPAGAGRGQLLFLLFPAGQLLLLAFWIRLTALSGALPQAGFTLSAVFLCAAAAAALAFVLNDVGKSGELRSRNEQLREQLQAQAAYGAALEERREQILDLRRDILARSEQLLEQLRQGREEEAARGLRELQADCGAASELVPGCEDGVLASFLFHRRQELEAAGLKPELRLRLPGGLRIDRTDLICALGNLLDNAEEASAGAEDKRICLRVVYREPYLRMETENALPAERRKKARRIPRLERGLGTEILKGLAERWDGEFRTGSDAGRYTASLILKEDKDRC